MDTKRSNFFWQGATDKFKYHRAKMDTLCRPKNQGSVGMLNTKIMNDCLLTNWIWKIMKGSEETWCKLLQAKYMLGGDFFKSKSMGTSQFWQGLHKIKHLFKWGAIHKVENGAKTSLWNDVWIGDVGPVRLTG